MVLTSDEIANLGLVEAPQAKGIRDTTYDATVGDIIYEGRTINGEKYVLPSRGMVWVVSHERFKLPDDVTGVATLRTTWTHKGILALNVGIVDPGWHGPLATALVNFSNTNFEIQKKEAFMRVLFLKHSQTNAKENDRSRPSYLTEIREKSSITPGTFLNMSNLASEMLEKFHGSGVLNSRNAKISAGLALAAAIIAMIAIFVPIAYGVSTEYLSHKEELKTLQSSVFKLEQKVDALVAPKNEIDALHSETADLRKQLDALQLSLRAAASPSGAKAR